MAYSFGSQGALPANNTSNPLGAGSLNLSTTNTPAARALATMSNPKMPSAPPPPSQPIKSQTHNYADGSSVQTNYHPTADTSTPQTTTNTDPLSNVTGWLGNQLTPMTMQKQSAPATQPLNSGTSSGFSGILPKSGPVQGTPATSNSNQNAPYGNAGPLPGSNPASTQSPTQTYGNSQYSAQNPPTYPGLIGSLANSAQQGSPTTQGAINATQNAAQSAYGNGSAQEQAAYQQAQDYQKQLQASQMNEAGTIANNNSQPIPLEFQQGRNQIAQTQYAQQQAALGAALQGESNLANIGLSGQGQGISGLGTAAGQANTAQGLQQQGLGQAAGLTAPIQVAPGSSVISPQTGQQLYSGLGSLNQYQQEQISNAQRGTYGPQAQQIGTGLNALNNTYSNVQSIMKAQGIDPTAYPDINAMLNILQAHATNPGGQAAFNEAMAQFKTQLQSQIQAFTSASAITPTDAGKYSAQLNASDLSPTELAQLYNAVEASGKASLSAVQGAYNESNQATQNATLPGSFGSQQTPQNNYTPPANLGNGNPFDPSQYNLKF